MNINAILKPVKLSYSLLIISYSLFSCSTSKQISKQANKLLINDTAISKGHIGISIYEPATGKYWYNHDADKYFIPSSNTKLFTLYAGMKYLGDSLVGMRYRFQNDSTIDLFPTADPTFLHRDFTKQPVLDFLNKQKKIIIQAKDPVEEYGTGWAWDDHEDIFMLERDEFPMYGNTLTVEWKGAKEFTAYPAYFIHSIHKPETLINGFRLVKRFADNQYTAYDGNDKIKTVPFSSDVITGLWLLNDTMKMSNVYYNNLYVNMKKDSLKVIYSRPVDSLFKPMMHNSDNFFAEQTLLMISNELLDYMNDKDIIDTLLKTVLKDVPQKPRWVDGSGLSRYNLFTPQSFIYILDKMRMDFGMERLKNILPTGGEGTLKNYYIKDSSYIYAKTGSMSNNNGLSGYLITRKGKLLIFSILVNNYQSGASPVRRATELFLQEIRAKY